MQDRKKREASVGSKAKATCYASWTQTEFKASFFFSWRLACSDPASCCLSLPFLSHYFPGSYLIPPEPIPPRTVLTFEASLEPWGSCYRVFISVGWSQARKILIRLISRWQVKALADPRGFEDSWEELSYFPESKIKNSHFLPQHPSSQGPGPSWIASITLSHLVFWRIPVFGGSFSKCGAWTTRRPQGDFSGTENTIFYFNNHVFILIF